MQTQGNPEAEGHQAELNHHPAARLVLDAADKLDARLELQPPNRHDLLGLLNMIPTVMRREAHLCTARYLAMLQDGLPPDAAEMLAQDDMGFQLVRGLVSE